MKKVLLSTIILTAFSLSIILFQISCKKEAQAEVSGAAPLNTILFSKFNEAVDPASGNSYEAWLANLDGTNQRKIPIVLPSEAGHFFGNCKLTAGGNALIFSTQNDVAKKTFLYSCSTDGSGMKKIAESAYPVFLSLEGVY